MPPDQESPVFPRIRARAASTGAGTVSASRKSVVALVGSVRELVDAAVDRVLLTDKHVTSAAEAQRYLTGDDEAQALADKIQRVVVVAVPVIRILVRAARFTRLPWVMFASSSASMTWVVRSGVRELQVLASLVAHRVEQATAAPSDPALVKKVAIELYLSPKRAPDLSDDRLRFLRLTRMWLLRAAFGRSTAERATKALTAAEKLDGAELVARWQSTGRRRGRRG